MDSLQNPWTFLHFSRIGTPYFEMDRVAPWLSQRAKIRIQYSKTRVDMVRIPKKSRFEIGRDIMLFFPNTHIWHSL